MKALIIKQGSLLTLGALFFLGACKQENKQPQNTETVNIEQVQYPGGEAAANQLPSPRSGMMVN